ncbi:4-aminobutyrate aminotransferase-like enzyme [Arthrobacter sp. CAN_A6]
MQEPNPEPTRTVAGGCLEDGDIILTCDIYGNAIRLPPPLVRRRPQIQAASA